MGFVITYKPLFEIQLLHHYHLDKGAEGDDYVLFDLADEAMQQQLLRVYNISTFLHIVPTAETLRLLQKHQCIFRMQEDRILVAIKVTQDAVTHQYQPVVPLADDLAFTFSYRIADPDFLNYTGLPLQDVKETVYFFRNKKEGTARKYPYLGKAAPVLVPGDLYNAGEILRNAGGTQTLIAGNISGPLAAPVQNFTADPQVNGAALVYVNRNDLLRIAGTVLTIDTGLQERKEHITVTMTNDAGLTVQPRLTLFEAANTQVQIDSSFLPEGLFSLHLEDSGSAYDETLDFYLRKENVPCDGLVQIQVKSDDATFSLLNNNGTLKEGDQLRRFMIRFKNRATVWRYLGHDFTGQPESGPHLLTRNGFVSLTINDDHAVPVTDPPNASVQMIRTESPEAAPGYYNLISEIYLNPINI